MNEYQSLKPLKPFETETEHLAYLYAVIATAYTRLANYERAERERRNQKLYDDLTAAKAASDADS